MSYSWHPLLTISMIMVSLLSLTQDSNPKRPPFISVHSADSATQTVCQLTLEQKIGQLFMVATVADEKENKDIIKQKQYRMDQEYIKMLIQDYHIGGIIFLGASNPEKQKRVTDRYQQISTIPLLIGRDLERGFAIALQNATHLPYAMTLGAITNNNLIYQVGKEIGRQCKVIGVNINFAPVVDINSNPLNPIINHRSFGQDKYTVARKATAFMHGLQDSGILACAKHFPGHGDTDIDSHLDLPRILHNKDRLDTLELYPFKKLIKQGVSSIMIAHLAIPALDKNNPSSISPTIVTKILRKKLAFEGLIITDALDMHALTNNYRVGEVELQALHAGNDILLCPHSVPHTVALIKQALNDGTFTMQQLDQHVQRILQVKHWIKQNHLTKNLEKLHTTHTFELKRKLFQAAITMVQNEDQLIPLDTNIAHAIPIIQIGSRQLEPFTKKLGQHRQIKLHTISHDSSPKTINQICQELTNKNTIIISMHGMTKSVRNNYGITSSTKQLINKLNTANKQVILVIFGIPYSIKFFKDTPAIIAAYENDPEAQSAAADLLLGNLHPHGTLPIRIET